MPPSQASQDGSKGRDFDLRRLVMKHYWLKATAVSSAAVGMVSAGATTAVAEDALTTTVSSSAVLPEAAQPEGYTLASAAESIDQGSAVLPDLFQTQQVSFANGQSADSQNYKARGLDARGSDARDLDTQDSGIGSAVLTDPLQTSVITQAQDGSWTLSTEVVRDSSDSSSAFGSDSTARSQTVLSDLAEETVRTRQACTGQRCRGLSYIEENLPKAQKEVDDLQAQLDDFETHRAQQDMEGYQSLLTARIFEVAQQEQDLAFSTDQQQRRITQLKSALVQMDADLELADRALASSAAYQADWTRLQQAEQNILNEFSQVKIDETELNEIYEDYQYHQSQAQTSATEALGGYLLGLSSTPSFIERSPDALNLLQNLAVTLHEYRVQKLRQSTIRQVKKRLSDRESQLIGDMSEYEKLQRELATARKVVEGYREERAQLIAQESAVAQTAQQSVNRSATALDRIRRLAPLVPKGSVSQSVVFAVLAIGAVGAIAARRRSKPVTIPALARQDSFIRDYSFQPTALQQANLMAAIKLPSLRLSAMQLQAEGPAISSLPPAQPSSGYYGSYNRYSSYSTMAPTTFEPVVDEAEEVVEEDTGVKALPASTARLHGEDALSLEEILTAAAPPQSDPDDFEQRILAELMEITGQSARLLEPAKTSKSNLSDLSDEAANELTIETMVRDLNEAIGKTTPEGSLAAEIQSRQLDPVQLSLENVDLFAECAVQWILKDLGISSPVAAELDEAEAEVRGWSKEEVAEIKAISIESLEIVQPNSDPAQYEKVTYQVVGKTRGAFANVAA